MRVKDIMTKKVISVDPDDSVTKVADIIFKNRFHGLPVVRGGKVAGIITEDDFFLKGYDNLYLPSYIEFIKGNKIVDNLPRNIKNKIEKLISATAKDLMTSPCLTVAPATPVSKLMALIKKTKFTTWPVVDGNKNLIGIVTLSDMLEMFRGNGDEMSKAYKKQVGKAREVDLIAEDVHSFWKKTFVFISKTQVRTWKGVFLIAFISGAFAALIWTVSVRINTRSKAEVAPAVLNLKTDSENIRVGDPFNVDVILDTKGSEVISAVAVVKYDPQEFKLEIWDLDESVFKQEGACVFKGNSCEIVENRPERGEISIKVASPKKGLSSDSGKIANLVFKSLKATHSISPNIRIDNVSSGVYRYSREVFGYWEMENILSEAKGIQVNASTSVCEPGMFCTGAGR